MRKVMKLYGDYPEGFDEFDRLESRIFLEYEIWVFQPDEYSEIEELEDAEKLSDANERLNRVAMHLRHGINLYAERHPALLDYRFILRKTA